MPTLTKARELLAEKNYPEALKLCDSLLAQRGAPAGVHTLKALIYQQSGNLEEAGHSMEMALEENPDHPSMLFTAALINKKLENYDLAKKQVMKAAREAPDNPQIICQCALLLGSLREPQKALDSLEKFTQKNKNHAQAWQLIGKFQKELGNEEAASFALEKYKSLQPA
jgi:tetratricopeptide (TPR) repeat protein